ncbi:sigma-70 family RNA polymerase sigma factor [Phytoactinopolyspora alkaliphila]|uniref:Sigma-70 family RNA polymerase sigma factor n=1 Tax=Phytoactinopolyspora alkaliphila TaxID=1783498 RepID=A0A6N9YRW4_9ACTN|nr:sigma-70 family RNA polymerase sigma factor [Phytoactinopolyspora alkaliphila]
MSEAVFDQARTGDEQAFRELTDPYRAELQLHCYRILGSLTDAEDMLQETLLAAWRNLDSVTSHSSLRAWLYRIATNRCLNELRAAKRRGPPEPVPPFQPPEPTHRSDVTWLQPCPDTLLAGVSEAAPGPEDVYDAKETVRLAFISSLQHLPPRQAAVLVLRDVLGYPLGDVAAMLEVTTTAAKGALQRARAALARRRQADAVRPASADELENGISERFAEAFTSDDIEGVVALLTDDAWLAMPPAPHQYHGAAAIGAFLRTSAAWRGERHFLLLPTRANRQPAFGCYLPRPDERTADAVGIVVLTLSGDRIHGITHFLGAGLHERFGLPDSIDPGLPTSSG